MKLKYPKLKDTKIVDGRYAIGLIDQIFDMNYDLLIMDPIEEKIYRYILRKTLNREPRYREVFIKSEDFEERLKIPNITRKRKIKSLKEKGFLTYKKYPFKKNKFATLYRVWIPEEIERRIEFSEVEREPLKLEKRTKEIDASEIRF